MLTADSPTVYVHAPREVSLKGYWTDDESIHQEKHRDERYRAERFAVNDGKPPIHVLIHEGMSIRQAFDQMIDCYLGDYRPANSSKKAEPSEVEVLMKRISGLEAMLEMSRLLISDLRERTGE
jgi:hypothetical protein